MIEIKVANMNDFESVVHGIDNILSKEGFGFVNKMQVKTEIGRKTVFIANYDGQPAGYRIGKKRLWNLAVKPEFRGLGVGKALLLYIKPNLIRVKNNPIGHLNKQQKNDFVDPTPFYEAMGFKCIGTDYGRNFWAGGSKGGGKQERSFSKKGKMKHISIYIDPDAWLL